MCKWGTVTVVVLTKQVVEIDSCISALVDALNYGGVETTASCCGHGKGPGSIVLADGRELVIAASRAQAEQLQNVPRLRAKLQEAYDGWRLTLEGKPQANGEYAHLVYCSGDRRSPPGTRGISCCCRPCGTWTTKLQAHP